MCPQGSLLYISTFLKILFFCDKDIIFSRNIGLRCVLKPVDGTGSSKKVIICHGHFLRGSSSCLLLINRHCFTLKTSHSLYCPWNLTFWMWLYHAKGRLLDSPQEKAWLHWFAVVATHLKLQELQAKMDCNFLSLLFFWKAFLWRAMLSKITQQFWALRWWY